MLPTSIQVWRKHTGLPCAMALRLIRFRPGDRLSCYHPLSEASASSGADASTGASDPNDFAVRKCSVRLRCSRVHRFPAATSATMAYAPLVGQDGGSPTTDLPDGASDLFLIRGLDTISDNQK